MTYHRSKIAICTAALSIATLAGCGGSSDSSTDSTSFPLQKALTNLYSTGYSKNASLKASVNGQDGADSQLAGSALVTETPAQGTVTFAEQTATQQTLTISGITGSYTPSASSSSSSASSGFTSATLDGLTENTPIVIQTYVSANNIPLGFSAQGVYCVANTFGGYPTNASVGQSGIASSSTCYTDQYKSTPLGAATTSYSVSAGPSSTTAIVSLTSSVYNATNQLVLSFQENYQIDSKGNIGYSSITVNGTSLTTNNVLNNISLQ